MSCHTCSTTSRRSASSTSRACRRRRTSSTSPTRCVQDVPVPSLPAERDARGGARAGSRGFRRSQPGCVAGSERAPRADGRRMRLTRVRAGEIDPGELFDAYRERAAADELNAFTWVADGPPANGDQERAARRRPARRQGPVLHRGRAEPGGLEDPRGLPAAVYRDRGQKARRSGRAAAGKDQPGRVRDGLLERELGLRARAQPVGSHDAFPAAHQAAARPLSPPASRRGRSAPTPEARSASPRRCAGSSASSPPTERARATG